MAETAASVPKEDTRGPVEAMTSVKETMKHDNGDGGGPRDQNENVTEGERSGTPRGGGRKPRGKPEGGWKSSRRGGRGNWRGGHGYESHGGGGYKGYDRQGHSHPYNRGHGGYQRREERKAEDLQKASLAQKDDKVVSFDCRIRPRTELTDWLRHHKPTCLKRSDKIGYIAVISQRCTSLTERKFTMTPEDLEEIHSELLADWEMLTADPTAKITYHTIMQLAKKHKVVGGKWLCNFDRRDSVDDTWMYMASAMAADANPIPCLAAKITPLNDTAESSFGRTSHMCSVYTEDFTDMENVFEVEKRLREIPIKKVLTYKPDIYTALGIYRNNKYNLSPTIFKSSWQPLSNVSVTDSVFDMDWSYQGGSGDLRDARTEARKKARELQPKDELEAMLDSVIDRVLGKSDDSSEAQKSDEIEGSEAQGEAKGEAESEDKAAENEAKGEAESEAKEAESEAKEAESEAKGEAESEAKEVDGEAKTDDQKADQSSEESKGKCPKEITKELVVMLERLPEPTPVEDNAKAAVVSALKETGCHQTDKDHDDNVKDAKKECAAGEPKSSPEAAEIEKPGTKKEEVLKTVESLIDEMAKANITEMAVGESGVVEFPEPVLALGEASEQAPKQAQEPVPPEVETSEQVSETVEKTNEVKDQAKEE